MVMDSLLPFRTKDKFSYCFVGRLEVSHPKCAACYRMRLEQSCVGCYKTNGRISRLPRRVFALPEGCNPKTAHWEDEDKTNVRARLTAITL